MKKNVFKKEICKYCKFNYQYCRYFNYIEYKQENNLETMKCNFYKKNEHLICK